MRCLTFVCSWMLLGGLAAAASYGTARAPAAPAASAAAAPVVANVTAAPATNVTAATTPTQPLDLFNGRDFTGWVYVAGQPMDIAKVCTVKDGVLAVTGKPNGYIATTTAYQNYTLHVEWRWTGATIAAGKVNSGVLLHLVGGPVQQNIWPKSFQIQTKDTRAGDVLPMGGATFGEPLSPSPTTAAASQKDRVAPASEKPLGEWNTCDIICRGDTIECSINGVPQNKVTKCSPAAGQIGFQLEGYPYEMRNVRLAPLPAPAKP